MASTGKAASNDSAEGSTLEVMVIPPRNDKHYLTLVYLHPFGSGFEGYTRDDYAQDWVRLVLPHAPYRPITCYKNEPMASWYDYLTDYGGEAEDDLAEDTLDDTRSQLFQLLDAERLLLGEENMSNDICKRLFIGGCSQGCGVALDAALRYPVCLAGFIGVVGHCLSRTPLGMHQGMPLHFFRKVDDQVMQWSWVQGTLSRLREAGYAHLHLHDPAPGRHNRSSSLEAGWIREAVGHIYHFHHPPQVSNVEPLVQDGLFRQFLELTRNPREAVDIRPLLECVAPPQEPARLLPVEIPWASRLAARVPLVCAVVDGVVSPQQADALRMFVEQQRQNCWDLSTSHLKTAVDDTWGLTDVLWSRMAHLMPATFRDKERSCLSNHMRFKKFGPGHRFKPHEDSSSTQSLGDYGYNTSELSAVLYLSDPGDATCGGRTRFLAPSCTSYREWGCCDVPFCSACVDAPAAKGCMVVFAHLLTNADTEVRYGVEKFIMRTDVMYRR